MRIALLLVLLFPMVVAPVSARLAENVPAIAEADVHQLQTVVVSGIQPGPGLWKVSKGEHVLWILGTVAPVPRKMEWVSPKTEAVLRQTQEIIGEPGVTATMGVGSMFKAAFAMPTMLRARKNPDGKTLHDVLPADVYARWSALKLAYLPKDDDVEEWRPIFAAGQLYQAAVERAGLQSNNGVWKRIDQVADRQKIKRTPTVISFEIKDPKRLAKSFAKTTTDETACFSTMLDRLERDVAHAAAQANAWAVGDMSELRRLAVRDNLDPCFEAFAKIEAVQSLGMVGADLRSEAKWMLAVDAALTSNQTSFATLPVRKLLQADGLLAKLQAKGYTVLAPE